MPFACEDALTDVGAAVVENQSCCVPPKPSLHGHTASEGFKDETPLKM